MKAKKNQNTHSRKQFAHSNRVWWWSEKQSNTCFCYREKLTCVWSPRHHNTVSQIPEWGFNNHMCETCGTTASTKCENVNGQHIPSQIRPQHNNLDIQCHNHTECQTWMNAWDYLFIMRGCLSRAEALYKWQNNILQLQRKKRLQHHLAWTCPWHKNWSLWCVLIKHLQAITPPPPSCPSCPPPSWLHLQMSSKGKWLQEPNGGSLHHLLLECFCLSGWGVGKTWATWLCSNHR